MRYDLKKRLLEIFTSKQKEIEAELKTAIFSSEDFYYVAMLYAISSVSDTTKRIVEPWLRGLAAASRGLGGKGSEQLLSLLYPARPQQYLFPIPVLSQVMGQQGNNEEKKEGETSEKKRRFFNIF